VLLNQYIEGLPWHHLIYHRGKELAGLKIEDSSNLREGYQIGFTGYPIGLF